MQTNTAAACQFVVDHSRANILVVENREQLDKVTRVQGRSSSATRPTVSVSLVCII